MEDTNTIGIDLGGTTIKGVLIDNNGSVIKQLKRSIHDSEIDNGKQWKNEIKKIVDELNLLVEAQNAKVGIAAPGLPNDTNSCIAFMPGRLYGLENFNFSTFLEQEKIPVINDALAALLAESKIGAGKGLKNLLMITLGTGVGGGILIDGKIHQGNGQRAGHLGHVSLDANGTRGITGMPGSIEDAIGNATVADRTQGKYTSTRELLEAYENKDPFATTVWLESVRKLAVCLASFCNILSPDKIIIGGGISNANELLFTPLAEYMETYEWRPGGLKTPIVKAICNEYSGAIGAAFYAMSDSIKK